MYLFEDRNLPGPHHLRMAQKIGRIPGCAVVQRLPISKEPNCRSALAIQSIDRDVNEAVDKVHVNFALADQSQLGIQEKTKRLILFSDLSE